MKKLQFLLQEEIAGDEWPAYGQSFVQLIFKGLKSLVFTPWLWRNVEGDIKKMHSYSVSKILSRVWTILKSAPIWRISNSLKEERKPMENLMEFGIERHRSHWGMEPSGAIFFENPGIPTVGWSRHKSSNDCNGTDYTIGFWYCCKSAFGSNWINSDTAGRRMIVFSFVEVMEEISGFNCSRMLESVGVGGGEIRPLGKKKKKKKNLWWYQRLKQT